MLVEVAALNDKVVELSLNDKSFPDFENALQYYSALEYDAEIIITGNLKDFKNSKIPVMTAKEYLSSLQLN